MGLALVLGHRVVVGDGTSGVERASAGARRRRRPNSDDEESSGTAPLCARPMIANDWEMMSRR